MLLNTSATSSPPPGPPPAQSLQPIGCVIGVLLAAGLALAAPAPGTPPQLAEVDRQPLVAQVRRLIEATDHLGVPFTAAEKQMLDAAFQSRDAAETIETVQRVLDPYCLVKVTINPESRVKVARGPAPAELLEHGWRHYLVKVHNEAGVTAELVAVSPNAQSTFEGPGSGRAGSDSPSDVYYRAHGEAGRVTEAELWLDLQSYVGQPLARELSGLALEYRLIQLYSRDAGRREAKLAFHVGQGTQDTGFRSEVDVLFACRPTREIPLRVLDEAGRPTTASFEIRDALGRVYPAQVKRVAPDFWFHPQVYRADGEPARLADGSYTIRFERGPESVAETRTVTVGPETRAIEFRVKRWIDPAAFGWWSGDHHIHAAGCAHYTNPSEGVHPPDMMRHCLGEDLKVGCNLTWGPCFDYQKQFFTGKDHPVSQPPYLLHYDVEVSGFGSHQSGHLCLLQLRDQIPPGGDSDRHWPTLGLNTLRWAKRQGAVCGPAHSGWGLQVDTAELPNYVVPPYDGIGANEYIVDVTHEVPGPDGHSVPAVDFMSAVDTPYVWELNMWYHTLNVGFRTRISGETDFPCIYGERVGLGRSYVRLDGPLTYAGWCEGIRQGRSYVGDGRSHLLEFKVDAIPVGERGSEVRLPKPGPVRVTARVAARLNEVPNPALQRRSYQQKPYWDIERARLGASRRVPVEVVVNGQPVARQELEADGALRDVAFDLDIARSSWVALRILPSSHTNPIWVLVDGQPVRASRRSATWCLQGVDRCWSQKQRHIAAAELTEARAAYDHARGVYRERLAECAVD